MVDLAKIQNELREVEKEIHDLFRQRTEFEVRLQKARKRHNALLALALGDEGEPSRHPVAASGNGNGTEVPLRQRIVGVLVDAGGCFDTSSIASTLEEDHKRVRFTLQDLRSKTKALEKPNTGLWELNDTGWALAEEMGIDISSRK